MRETAVQFQLQFESVYLEINHTSYMPPAYEWPGNTNKSIFIEVHLTYTQTKYTKLS